MPKYEGREVIRFVVSPDMLSAYIAAYNRAVEAEDFHLLRLARRDERLIRAHRHRVVAAEHRVDVGIGLKDRLENLQRPGAVEVGARSQLPWPFWSRNSACPRLASSACAWISRILTAASRRLTA